MTESRPRLPRRILLLRIAGLVPAAALPAGARAAMPAPATARAMAEAGNSIAMAARRP